MSLGPREATVKLTLGGVVADEFYIRYTRAIVQAMQASARWLEDLELEIPKTTEDLRRSFEVTTDLYGQEKTLTVQVTRPYAKYVLEFGREPGRRPPWDKIREWAAIKGVPLKKARAWWWKHGRTGKAYRGPKGSLFRWWSTHMNQLKYVLERELKAHLEAAGFSLQDVQVTYS